MPDLESVLPLIRTNLSALGHADAEFQRDTGWIRAGYEHCRRFDYGDVQVVWFLEGGQVRFYGAGRTLLRVGVVEDGMRSAA